MCQMSIASVDDETLKQKQKQKNQLNIHACAMLYVWSGCGSMSTMTGQQEFCSVHLFSSFLFFEKLFLIHLHDLFLTFIYSTFLVYTPCVVYYAMRRKNG